MTQTLLSYIVMIQVNKMNPTVSRDNVVVELISHSQNTDN